MGVMNELQKMFLTHHNLQGSQTCTHRGCGRVEFLTHHNLQGSQTNSPTPRKVQQFLTHHNLQGSQTTFGISTTTS